MDPGKILTWNVRGLNSSLRQDSVRELVDSAHVDVVCLQETKMQSISLRTVFSMLGADFPNYVHLPSVGVSGGILVAWRRHVGHTGQQRVDNHGISIQFCRADGQGWWPTYVYGPQGDGEKIQFLQELRDAELLVMDLGWYQVISTTFSVQLTRTTLISIEL